MNEWIKYKEPIQTFKEISKNDCNECASCSDCKAINLDEAYKNDENNKKYASFDALSYNYNHDKDFCIYLVEFKVINYEKIHKADVPCINYNECPLCIAVKSIKNKIENIKYFFDFKYGNKSLDKTKHIKRTEFIICIFFKNKRKIAASAYNFCKLELKNRITPFIEGFANDFSDKNLGKDFIIKNWKFYTKDEFDIKSKIYELDINLLNNSK